MKNTIGKMRDQVIFQKQTRTADGMGGYTYVYQSQAPLWGDIIEVPINRYFHDNTVDHQAEVKVIIRKNDDIDVNWVLYYNDIRYQIENLYNDLKYTYVELIKKTG